MADNRTATLRFLRSKGLTPAQAAGVVGSLMQESNLRTDARNPSSGALGIGQWLGGRKTNLLNQGKSNSLQGQLNFLWSELQGPERAALKRLQGAHTVEDAASAFTWGFERPGQAEANMANRVKQGRAALGLTGSTASGSDDGGDEPQYKTTTKTTPGVDNRQARAQLILSFLNQKSADPVAFATQANTLRDVAPTTTTTRQRLPGQSAPSPAASGGSTSTPGGTANFEGKKVAAWIAPALEYARQQGWKGQVNSGFRSLADQTRIYNSGVRPAARPGTSNHEGADFPRGAVDVSDPQTLSRILRASPWARKLVYAGTKDPVHFSHPHGGSY